MSLGDRLRVDKCDCERVRVQIAQPSFTRNEANASADSASSTTPLTRTTQLRCGKPRTVTTDAAKVKQVELWQLEKCDLRVKVWEAREIQLEVRVGAKRECLSKLVVRLKNDRIDDDSENERNQEGLRDCFFPQYNANPGASLLMRRTERDVRRDSCDKLHIVTTELDGIHVLCAIVSVKTLRKSCVTVASGLTGCLMMIGIERWESHKCNKPGQLRTDCSVYKKRIAEKGNKPKGKRVETTAVVQRVRV